MDGGVTPPVQRSNAMFSPTLVPSFSRDGPNPRMSKLVHLVYIHGFQGNDTSFQSFPLDLQNHLSPRIPPHLDIRIQSSLYPTYKSVKPLSYAAKNFLEWLQTQPPGPVILLGHSMGGLLAAEAAIDPSNGPDAKTGKPRRIVGVVAFDTPFLGMHPHVIISGIASLFPKSPGNGEKKSEGEMNAHPAINIVPEQVTDDWEELKRNGAAGYPGPAPSDKASQLTVAHSTSSTSSKRSSRSLSRSPSPLLDRVVDFASRQSNNPFVRWLKKHSDDPLAAGQQWVTERLQFGGAMFDPTGLKERYIRLVNWRNGLWVNYWTHTLPADNRRPDDKAEARSAELAYNDRGLIESGIVEPPANDSSQIDREWMEHITNAKNPKSKSEKEKSKEKRGRHFIVLPTGMGKQFGGGERWENVIIGGVEDEVAAHCGLFIRGQNLDYDGLLERVATRILAWCEQL